MCSQSAWIGLGRQQQQQALGLEPSVRVRRSTHAPHAQVALELKDESLTDEVLRQMLGVVHAPGVSGMALQKGAGSDQDIRVPSSPPSPRHNVQQAHNIRTHAETKTHTKPRTNLRRIDGPSCFGRR